MTFTYDPATFPTRPHGDRQRFDERSRTPEGFTLYAYAAVQAWLPAAEATGSTDSARIAEWLRGGNRVQTVVGPMSFDAKGDLREPLVCLVPLVEAGAMSRSIPARSNRPNLSTHPLREPPMRAFFVQIKCELGKSYEVATAIADAEIASEIYSTAGGYDLLVKFYLEREGRRRTLRRREDPDDPRHPRHLHDHHLQGLLRCGRCWF